jgi:hypothetical protein
VEKQLVDVMFHGEKNAKRLAKDVVRKLSSYKGNLSHSRPIHFEELKAMRLKVMAFEDNQQFQDAVLPIHHCYMYMLMNTSVFKVIENQNGVSYIKMFSAPQSALPNTLPPQP